MILWFRLYSSFWFSYNEMNDGEEMWGGGKKKNSFQFQSKAIVVKNFEFFFHISWNNFNDFLMFFFLDSTRYLFLCHLLPFIFISTNSEHSF